MTSPNKKYRSILPQGGLSSVQREQETDGPSAVASSNSGSRRSIPLPVPETETRQAISDLARDHIKKRKRVGVRIACNACRLRKARCDGKRPRCDWCVEKDLSCIYADPERRTASHRSPSDADKLLELLRTEPEEKIPDIVKQIREQDDLSIIVAGSRDSSEAESSQRLPGSSFPSEALGSLGIRQRIGVEQASNLEKELMVESSIAYPSLPSLSAFPRKVLDLIRSPRGNSATSSGKTQSPGSRKTVVMGDVKTDSSTSSSMTSAGTSPTRQVRQPESSDSATATPQPSCCDERLDGLDITQWTDVPIDSKCAIRVISLYLETDHPLLGVFDPDTFVVAHNSPTKALMSIAESATNPKSSLPPRGCLALALGLTGDIVKQMYSAIEHEASAYVQACCDAAERSWAEGLPDALPNLAALSLLSLAYIGHGKDHCVLNYRNAACQMAQRMSLLGVSREAGRRMYENTAEEMRLPTSYAAWGTFNWIVLTSLFYQQPGFHYPENPPEIPVPDPTQAHDPETQAPSCAPYMGETLPALCKFWRICHGISLEFFERGPSEPEVPSAHVSLVFAELKYRELLSWAQTLPETLIPTESSPHHVVICHIWFHAAVLDLFRPYLRQYDTHPRRFVTFYSEDNTPDAAFNASVKQLKRLVLFYRSTYPSSSYTILWHTALVYITNAVLQDTDGDEEWRLYLQICMDSYARLRRSYRLAEVAGRALLSMSLRQGSISAEDARKLLEKMEHKGLFTSPESIRATFMGDLSLAFTHPDQARVEELSRKFEDLAMFQEFTNMGEYLHYCDPLLEDLPMPYLPSY